jgi:hypothetical protein
MPSASLQSVTSFTVGMDTLEVHFFTPAANTTVREVFEILTRNHGKLNSGNLAAAWVEYNNRVEKYHEDVRKAQNNSSSALPTLETFEYLLNFFARIWRPSDRTNHVLVGNTDFYSAIHGCFSFQEAKVAIVDHVACDLSYQGTKRAPQITQITEELTQEDALLQEMIWHLDVGFMNGVKEAIFPPGSRLRGARRLNQFSVAEAVGSFMRFY